VRRVFRVAVPDSGYLQQLLADPDEGFLPMTAILIEMTRQHSTMHLAATTPAEFQTTVLRRCGALRRSK
jgi:hypothetical protein